MPACVQSMSLIDSSTAPVQTERAVELGFMDRHPAVSMEVPQSLDVGLLEARLVPMKMHAPVAVEVPKSFRIRLVMPAVRPDRLGAES